MRILFMSSEYPPKRHLGGIATYVSLIARALAARGHEVHVLSCWPDEEDSDALEGSIVVHWRRFVSLRGLGRLRRVLSGNLTAFRLALGVSNFVYYRQLSKQFEFDVVEYPDTNAEGWLFALAQEVPTVAFLHTPTCIWGRFTEKANRDFRLSNYLEHLAVEGATIVTAPSRLIVQELRRFGWLKKTKPTIIPYCIDLGQWDHLPPPSDAPPVVAFIGRVERCKAPELLAEAISIVRHSFPSAKAIFIGRSRGERNALPYLQWLKSSGLDLTGCEFVGQIQRDELPSMLAGCRVVASPSWFESFSLATAEAMAAGRPAIVTSTSGIAEVITEEGGGVVIPPGDPKALAEALLPFLEDPVHASVVGARARQVVQERLDPARIAEAREQVYKSAVASFQGARKGNPLKRILFLCCNRWIEWSDPETYFEVLSRSECFPHAIDRRVGHCEIPNAWRQWAMKEALRWPGYHFYLRTAEHALCLISKHPSFQHLTTLCGVQVLDLGSTPAVSVLFACLGAEVYLVDISLGELLKAKTYGELLAVRDRIRLVQADAFHLPFKAESFDIVWNSGFIEHFDNPEVILHEMIKVLRRRGAVLTLVPNKWTLHTFWIRGFLRRKECYFWDWMGRERSYTAAQLVGLLRNCGVEVNAASTKDLRRAILDDYLVIERLARGRGKALLIRLISWTDWLEKHIPFLKPFGFMVGAVAMKETGEVD
ncbi:MAG: glycosyltransferase [Candidatus Methanomethyliaceae archaeon]|uniref:glycosyltransferase n=1 Tax=Candidatus Hadarchaeum sp. TaxID=2883567 RepID=UPI0031763F7A